MAVLIEHLNLIVKVSTLERKYPGGLMEYRRHTLRHGFCCDGLITRVGSPACSEIETLISGLREKGFETVTEFGYRDTATVDEHQGLTVGCLWLKTGKRPDGLAYAFMPETDPHLLIAVPPGWSRVSDEAGEYSAELLERSGQMLFLRRDGSANVFLNRRTGELIRVPLPAAGAAERVIN